MTRQKRRSLGASIVMSVALLLMALGHTSLFAQQPARAASSADTKDAMAILDLVAVGASKEEASALTDRLREEMLRPGTISLVDRSQMNALLDEKALQQSLCVSQDCAVKLGKMLGVKRLVTGKVIKLSDQLWQVSALMVDVDTALTLRADSIRHRGDMFSLLDVAIVGLAAKFVGAAPRAPQAVASASPPPAAVAGAPPVAPPPPVPQAQAWPAGKKMRVAIFPIEVTGANLMGVYWLIEATAKSLADIPDTVVAYTAYPQESKGALPLTAAQIPKDIRSNGAPDAPTAVGIGKDLQVDAMLFVSVRAGIAVTMDSWLVDVSTGRTFKASPPSFNVGLVGPRGRDARVAQMIQELIGDIRNPA